MNNSDWLGGITVAMETNDGYIGCNKTSRGLVGIKLQESMYFSISWMEHNVALALGTD